ncbi:hypothetical protein HN51_012199 [Arachis hypogaea]|uniref:F-box domain-containing protein n=1 Tax=Arachis hypogaea TaxID=3818 RepID=A0A445DVP7_ARAHY|nr:hypothetical protein Ahy_A03g013578 [Arachis hypogaea]
MSHTPPNRVCMPHLGDELVWKIFAKANSKTVGRCRSTNQSWRYTLLTPSFVKEHYKQNKNREQSVIIGIGYYPANENSQWFERVDAQTGEHLDLNIPVAINNFGYYALIGSDHGNLCLRYSQDGLISRLLIWNPLTRMLAFASDEARKHSRYAVSIYAFGYLEDTIEYRIVHVYKRHYSDTKMSWTFYNSYKRNWTEQFKAKSRRLARNTL